MNQSDALHRTRRIGTGLAFITFPLVFVFAFAGHPDLLNPHLLGAEIINLTAAILLAIAFVPYGIRIIKDAPLPALA